jgi:hypothetical protein
VLREETQIYFGFVSTFATFAFKKMKKIESTFKDVWNVVATETRGVGAEWLPDRVFGPGEWSLGFMEGGRWIEVSGPDDEIRSGRWVFDDRTGCLMTTLEDSPEQLRQHLFESEPTGGIWLHTCEGPNHRAYRRQHLTKA